MTDSVKFIIEADGRKAEATLDGLAAGVDRATASTKRLNAAQRQAARSSDAFGKLGIRSSREIQREIAATQAAYKRLAASGSLSRKELARAQAAAKTRVAELNKELAGSAKTVTQSFNKIANAVVGVAAVAAAGKAFTYVVGTAKEFEKSISDLSAITGATGQDLDFLSSKALEFGATTTLSASQAAEAFKLVASAKPDLLANRDALAAVTREAITLSEAAGISLPEAANALGSSLNQFNADASESTRFINVMAAGAKFGASEIGQTSQALKVAGTVASNAGLSFEQTNAAIQALAAVSIKGSEAGTGLRGVLLKLSTQTNKNFNPEVVGFTQAIQNLAAANLTTTEKTKLFGQESITAANALIQQAGSLDELIKKLTGTKTAYEQADVRTNNLDGDIKKLNSAIEAQSIAWGKKLDPALRSITQKATAIISDTKIMNELIPDLAVGLAAVGAQALIGAAGLTKVTISMATATAGAKALGKALLPLAAAEGALKIFEAGKIALEAYNAQQEAAGAATRNHNVALKTFEKHLVPATAKLKELGIDINTIDPFNIEQVTGALHKLNRATAKEAGGGNVKAYMDAIKQGATQAEARVVALAKARELEAQKAKDVATGAQKDKADRPQITDKQRKEAEREFNIQEKKYAALAELSDTFFATEQEKADMDHWLKVDKLTQQYQKLYDNEALSNEQRLQLKADHIAALNVLDDEWSARTFKIAEETEKKKLAVEKQARDARLSLTSSTLGTLSDLLSQGGRKAFEASKALAIAETVVSTYSAAQKAYESQLAIPTPDAPVRATIAAAAAVAQGVARVAAISSTSYGSKGVGGGGAGGGGPNVSPRAQATAAGIAPPTPPTTGGGGVTVNVQVTALDPAGVRTSDLQRIGGALAPILQKNFQDGTNMAVTV